MKNIFLSALIVLGFSSLAQENGSWRLGVQWGLQGNHSDFTGGMEDANARFHHNDFGGGGLNIAARYDYNQHWMFMTGIGFNSFGFEYALSGNYSLLRPESQYSTLRSEFSCAEIPAMIFYKFNPTCRNNKWLVGAGFTQNLTGSQTIQRTFVEGTEGNTNGNYLNSVTNVNGGNHIMLRFSVGREKVFKRGSIFNASLLFNAGLSQLATSKVIYTVDGKEYTHEFNNNGNFIGLRFTYFFRQLGKSTTK